MFWWEPRPDFQICKAHC